MKNSNGGSSEKNTRSNRSAKLASGEGTSVKEIGQPKGRQSAEKGLISILFRPLGSFSSSCKRGHRERSGG